MRDFSEDIEKAIDLLLTLRENTSGKKLLLDNRTVVYLQVVLFRIPFTPVRIKKYINLRHSLYGDDPEICLFVPNRQTGVPYKKTTDELIDFCVDYYTELLEKHKIKGIKTIMPLKQLRAEYGTYEMRRKLVRRFDLFLCKNSLLYNPRFISALGKIFISARKEPLGISFPKEDVDYDPEFQKNIDRAIFTSTFVISRFSDNYSIPFGCLTNKKSELKENLQTVLDQLLSRDFIPGGFKNIRAIYLWPSQSKPIPFYISTELPVGLKLPTVKSKKRGLKGVEGEISTQPNKKVFVTPRGEVFVTKIKQYRPEKEIIESEDDDSFVDDSGDDDAEDKEKQNANDKERTVGNEEESESEDDEEIEKKEARLMMVKLLNDENLYSSKKGNEDSEEEEEKDEDEEEEKVGFNAKQRMKKAVKGKKGSSNQNAKLKKNKLQKVEKKKKNLIKSKRKLPKK